MKEGYFRQTYNFKASLYKNVKIVLENLATWNQQMLCLWKLFGSGDSSLFSELSLALNKEGLWLTKTDTQPEQTLRWATHQARADTHLL